MHSIDPETAAEGMGRRPSAPRQLLRIVRFMVLATALGLLLLAGGFLWFVHSLPASESGQVRKADGIVVLTGGALRINDALELLAAGNGRRLLITGVNRATRVREISRLMPEHRQWFSCCVDLDYSATNTIGNAIEARRWAKAQRFKSLIVVTSNFHMPRAMAELAYQLPDVTLAPYPVVSDRVRVESWWSSPSTARLLFWEYLKYIVVRVRTKIPFALA